MKRFFKIALPICAIIFAIVGTIALLLWNGIIWFNNPSNKDYPIRGVDVSHYQGDIDWAALSSQDIEFAFIKATEGSSYVDEYFDYNFKQAQASGIDAGAYHFFSYDSAGLTQAENFIRTVTPFDGMLPPVVDVEFYGDKASNPPERDDVDKELADMLTALEEYYGLKPIIYTTQTVYDLYLRGDYADYDIWIRDVITKPSLSDGRGWAFWQYSNRGRLDGYNGEEKFIDMNVYVGDTEAWASYPRYGK